MLYAKPSTLSLRHRKLLNRAVLQLRSPLTTLNPPELSLLSDLPDIIVEKIPPLAFASLTMWLSLQRMVCVLRHVWKF